MTIVRVDKKELILEHAVQLFGEYGYYRTTTAQVAKAAGVTQPYIYHFFSQKEDLFNAVLDRAASKIREAFSMVEGTAEEIAHHMSHAFQRIMTTHRNEVLLVMQSYTIPEPMIRDRLTQIYRSIYQTIAAKFSEANVPDPQAEAAKFIATGHFLVVIDVLGLSEMHAFKEGPNAWKSEAKNQGT